MANWEMRLDPPSEPDAAQPVVGLVFTGDAEAEPPEGVLLIEGDASSISIGKYQGGEVTDALAERVVPSAVDAKLGGFTLRPTYPLALGQRYTLISRSGLLGRIVVNPTKELPYLSRIWPPRDSSEPTLQTIYCGNAAPLERVEMDLFPTGRAALEPGLDAAGNGAGNCIHVMSLTQNQDRVQPPASQSGFALEPTPWVIGAELPEVAKIPCEMGELLFGPGCASVNGSLAVVRAPASTTFWVLRSELGWHHRVVEGGGRFSVPLLDGLKASVFDIWTYDLAGRIFAATAEIPAPVPTARVVINEVMANPLGAEPSEEWIEIVNAGSLAAEMIGWRLRDQAGEAEIPPILLEPGATALLVRFDFLGGQNGDVAPLRECAVVRLATLGKNGLTNSGEAVALLDALGNAVSSFPARSSDREGVSLARRSPTELDDASQSFSAHASPGASPCAANVVE